MLIKFRSCPRYAASRADSCLECNYFGQLSLPMPGAIKELKVSGERLG